MTPVTLEIIKLGPIADSAVEIRPLTIYTGESGLGKSYAAFATHYIYELFGNLRIANYFDEEDVQRAWQSASDGDAFYTVDVAHFIGWMEKDLIRYVSYLVGNPHLAGEVKYRFNIPEKKLDFIRHDIRQEINGNTIDGWQIACLGQTLNVSSKFSRFSKFSVAILLGSVMEDLIFGMDSPRFNESIILPPSRASLMDAVNRPAFQAGMYDRFFDLKERLMSNYYDGFHKTDEMSAIVRHAIDGDLIKKDGKLFFQNPYMPMIPLSAAASSVKELAPYLMWLNNANGLPAGIIFEEPEAHLHPSRQAWVVDTFGYLLEKDSCLVITTHSDYVLKRVNMLGRLNEIRKTDSSCANEIMRKSDIDTRSLIDFSEMSGYLLVSNGDGTSRIEDIKTPKGISFASFEKVIEDEFDLSDKIEEFESLTQS